MKRNKVWFNTIDIYQFTQIVIVGLKFILYFNQGISEVFEKHLLRIVLFVVCPFSGKKRNFREFRRRNSRASTFD